MTYDELLDKWLRKLGRQCSAGEIVHDLRQLEQPVRHGHWEQPDYMAKLLEVQVCSVCSGAVKITDALYGAVLNYCPHCGAKMDGERREDGTTD